MTDSDSQGPPVFILAGMHRSGTSMAAAILQACGVHMGDRLMGASRGNERGHFENLDFVEFQRKILSAAGHHDAGWVHNGVVAVPAEGEFNRAAHALIAASAARAGPQGWGWKDPRSTLFLEDWLGLLPAAHVVLLYRSPWDVLHSICRRNAHEDQFFRENPARILHVWRHYNECVLRFIRAHPRESLLVCNDAVAADPGAFVNAINDHFALRLPAPPPDVVDAEMLQHGSVGTLPQLVLRGFPDLLPLLLDLDTWCALKSPALGRESLENCAASRDFGDALRHCFELGRMGALDKDAPSRAKLEMDLGWHQQKVAELESQLAAHQQNAEAMNQDWQRLREGLQAMTDAQQQLRAAHDAMAAERLAESTALLAEVAADKARIANLLAREKELLLTLEAEEARWWPRIWPRKRPVSAGG